MKTADADELLTRLGRRVGLHIGEKTTRLARLWMGGHPLLHRQLGSALLRLARRRGQTQKHVWTDPFCTEAIDLFLDRYHVVNTPREIYFLLSKRYPEASLHFRELCLMPPKDLKGSLASDGGWHRPAIRTLRKLGLVLGSREAPYIPEILRWYIRMYVPGLERIAV